LLADDGQQLVVRAAHGLEEGGHDGVTIPLGRGFAGRIAARRAPLIVDDLSTFPVVRRFLREHARSAVGVPLVLRERVLGVLHVDSAEPHHFTEREVQLLQRVAERVALAVERAQLFQAEHEARRDTEAALARALASEARFHRLVDSGIIGIVVGDRERVLEANDAYLRLLGYSRQDLEAGRLTWQAVSIRREMVAASEYAETEALEKGVSRPLEQEYVRRDGSQVPVLVGAALLQREPPLFVSFVVDLSDQKRFERSWRESERLFRVTFEQAAVGMARVATDGSWLDVNRRLCELVGYSREELAERTFQDLTYSDLTADLESRRQMLAGERDRYETDKRYVRKGGTLVWVHLTVSLVRDAAGMPQYFVSVIEDISARKQAEREREEARASELAAQEIARQLDEFFATAAHDIRNPLTALIGNVDLARLRAERLVATLAAPCEREEQPGGTPAARLKTVLDNVADATEHMRRLVTMLFDVSRARAGTLALTLAPCDLGTLMREQVAAQQANTPGRTIVLDLPDQPAVVVADADRLGQVLTN
ncbi:MAG TPA: PAS domain S-box protein, partial [Chloroflexota bacterium]